MTFVSQVVIIKLKTFVIFEIRGPISEKVERMGSCKEEKAGGAQSTLALQYSRVQVCMHASPQFPPVCNSTRSLLKLEPFNDEQPLDLYLRRVVVAALNR